MALFKGLSAEQTDYYRTNIKENNVSKGSLYRVKERRKGLEAVKKPFVSIKLPEFCVS